VTGKILKDIFTEVKGEWRKQRNEELNDLHSFPKFIRAIKSRRMLWAWQVARKEEKKRAYRVLVGKP